MLTLLLASCAGTQPPPAELVVDVALPPAPAPPASSTASAGDPSDAAGDSPQTTVELINARLRIVTKDGPRQSVEVQKSGRVLKRVTEDSYEEDFFLKDVSEVVYEHEADWPNPHVARVKLEPESITRWRRNGEEWTVSTIMHVSFVFSTKKAADDVVQAFRKLTNR